MALDSRLDDREFDFRPPRLVWYGRAYHLGISPSHLGELSLLPYVGRETSIGQSAVTPCCWGVKAEWFIPLLDERLGGR